MTRLLIALSCCASLWLSGCSDASSSSSDPTTPTPTSSSPAPSPTEEPETPEEFVRRWVELANQLGRDGKPGPLLAASHQCADCSSIANGVAQIYEAGGWIHGGDWTLVDQVAVDRHGPRFTCSFELSIEVGKYKSAKGAPTQDTPGGTASIRATISKIDGEFRMNEFVRLAQ